MAGHRGGTAVQPYPRGVELDFCLLTPRYWRGAYVVLTTLPPGQDRSHVVVADEPAGVDRHGKPALAPSRHLVKVQYFHAP